MTLSPGLFLSLALLLAIDAWGISLLATRGALTLDPMLQWAQRRLGLAGALALRAGLVLSLILAARLLLGARGDWAVLAAAALAGGLAWRRLRRLARIV